jgi:hypothetical protein
MQEKCRFSMWLVAICLLSTLLLSCKTTTDTTISSENLRKLKARYDAETVNYFYETVFHVDHSDNKVDYVSKRKSNPKIVLLGKPSPAEIGYVKDAISEINQLKLPIKCTLGDVSDSTSIDILFGNSKEVGTYLKIDSLIKNDVDSKAHFGEAHTVSYDGEISKAYIGICYNPNDTTRATPKNIVLEEIIQSLGITGDSYSYPASLFFENDNREKSFNYLDRNVLSLLYDPAIPVNYPRQSFENDFADVLYVINTNEKITKLLTNYRDSAVKDDAESCFISGILLKHPKETNVYLFGAVEREDSATINQAIFSVNQISPNLKIKLSKPISSDPDYGVMLTFRQLGQQKESVKITNEVIIGKSCMFKKLIKNKVILSYNKNENSRKFRQQSIVDALYFSLLQLPQNRIGSNQLFELKNGKIHFQKRYADLLKLIYSNEMVDGLKLGDFRKTRKRDI